MLGDIDEPHPILTLIERPIQIEDLQQPFIEALGIENDATEIRPEARIQETVCAAFAGADSSELELASSACYQDFFERLDELWDLDIPYDSFDADMTFGGLVEVINRMVAANNVLRLRIDWKVLQACFMEWDDVELEEADLTGTVGDFFEAIDGVFTGTEGPDPTLSDSLMTLIDTLYLDFSKDELERLDALATMDEVYRVLDRKLAARKRNDCLVRFGKNWSLGLRNLTREKLAELGEKSGSYPLGSPDEVYPR